MKTPHQPTTSLDWLCGNGSARIAYDYPHSDPALPQQSILVKASDIPSIVERSLEHLRAALRERRKVTPIRLPHQEKFPTFQDNILTVVTRDQTRPEVPLMRLTYYETFEGLPRVENQIRMEKPDFDDNQDLHAAWNKVRQWSTAGPGKIIRSRRRWMVDRLAGRSQASPLHHSRKPAGEGLAGGLSSAGGSLPSHRRPTLIPGSAVLPVMPA